MRVDDRTRQVSLIRDATEESYQRGKPSCAEHRRNVHLMTECLEHVHRQLHRRLPGGGGGLADVTRRLNEVSPPTISALVASGAWDTYRPGGAEPALEPARLLTAGWKQLVAAALLDRG